MLLYGAGLRGHSTTSKAKTVRDAVLLLTGLTLQGLFSGVVSYAGLALTVVGALSIASRLASNPERHWKLFNVGCRIAGFWFTFGGLVFIAYGVDSFVHPEHTPATGMGVSAALVSVFLGCFLAIAGLFLLLARAYRPDLGDAPIGDRALRILWGLPSNCGRPVVPGRESRTWWTGESKRVG